MRKAKQTRKKVSRPKQRHEPAPTMEAILVQYSRLIHKAAWGCRRRLPDASLLSEEDLFQEGVLEILKAQKYFQRKRGSLSTFLTVVVRNRMARVMWREWKRYSIMDTRITSHEIEYLNRRPAGVSTTRCRSSAMGVYRSEYRNALILR